MHAAVHHESVTIGPLGLPGRLDIPADSRSLVLFAQGNNSGPLNAPSERIVSALWSSGLSTLRFDLLTEPEAMAQGEGLDLRLLARRVVSALDWVASAPATADMHLGLFGANSAAAAALEAAAAHPGQVAAVVSRGGRPDLAQDGLERVQAPTLLIVGASDLEMIARHREAIRRLRCPRRLEVIPGASHQFVEPGTLDSVATLAAQWFKTYLQRRAGA